jgi:hypothetical protein
MPSLPVEIYVICFGTASVIHAAYVVLAARMMRRVTGWERVEARMGVATGVMTFFWLFGNFLEAFTISLGLLNTALFRISSFIRDGALVSFPLLFSYICLQFPLGPRANRLRQLAAYLRFPLWPWTVLAAAVMAAADAGFHLPLEAPRVVGMATLHIMLLYFVVFTLTMASYHHAPPSVAPRLIRARNAGLIAGILSVATFVLMLSGYWHFPIPLFGYIELAAMLTPVPFLIATAYRLYQFPFMDAFIREVISGVILLVGFIAALAVSKVFLWVTVCAMILLYCKAPVTRWVERAFLGYEEPVEEQEERIGVAIRALTQLDGFRARISEILSSELEAQWVEIDAPPRTDAVHRFEIAGAGLWISVGSRIGGRPYMSRQLRIARTAALQLEAHHHQLRQLELRDSTARAQMRALKAQINPHFLFNTRTCWRASFNPIPRKRSE